jgi:ferredoxin
MTRSARLIVDPIACDGRGLCAELLPELIKLDDWGFPMIPDGDIPARLQGEAATVVRLCPRLALRLERAAGTP